MMQIITDSKEIRECVANFTKLMRSNTELMRSNKLDETENGFTFTVNHEVFFFKQIPDNRGANNSGVLRHHIFFGMLEGGRLLNLLEINIPYKYAERIGSIRGRIATDGKNHYILRSTIGMTTSGRVRNMREQVENEFRDRVVNIEEKPWIVVCNIDNFDISEVINVLNVIKSCRDGVFFPNIPEEIINSEPIIEGAKRTVTVNRYERDATARRQCLEYWGVNCCICGFNFEESYGDHGTGYIHVHHLKPLAEIGEEYQLDPINDLRPVCPNCHAMIHRSIPALTIDELKDRLAHRLD